MLKRIRTGRPILVLGNGLSLWSSCHRDDVGLAFANATGNEKAFGRAYHASSDEFMTWLDINRTIARVMGAPEPAFVGIPTELLRRISPETFLWSFENFQYDNIFDNTRAREDLGFRSTITWADGVQRMIANHDSRNAINTAEEDPRYEQLLNVWHRLSLDMEKALSSIFASSKG
jgi:nucleoside-diphosphate-sugar epimerase